MRHGTLFVRRVLGLLLLFAGTALADEGGFEVQELMEQSLEDLLNIEVVSATKTKSRLEQAPAIITVITGEDLIGRGYQSVGEALHHTVGFYVVDDFILPNAGVRGIPGGLFEESGLIKVMIDGHPVAFRATGGNWLGPELLPLSAVRQIEIIRGPVSALYGADAFLGVVNVITIDGETLEGGEIRAVGNRISSNGELGYGFDAAFGGEIGSLDWLIAGRVNRENRSRIELPKSSPAPFLPAYKTLSDKTIGLLDSEVGLLKLRYQLGESMQLVLTGHLAALERSADLSPWVQLSEGLDEDGVSHKTTIDLYQGRVGLAFQGTLVKGLDLIVDLGYFAGGPGENDRIEVGVSNVFYIKRTLDYQGMDGLLEARWDILESLNVIGGVEVALFSQQLPSCLRVLNFATDDLDQGEIAESASTRQGRKWFENVGSYLQLAFTPVEWLKLTGGVRYDYNSTYMSQYSGRAGVVTRLFEGMDLKLLYGSAFKAPSPLLMHAVPFRVGDIVGNPDLEPQYVHTVEGQLFYRFMEYFSLSTALSYSYLEDKAEFIQQGVNREARNLAEVSSLSWAIEGRAAYKDWVQGELSFELAHTLQDRGDLGYMERLIGSEGMIYPQTIFRFLVQGRIPAVPLRVVLEGMLVGTRRESDMNTLERGQSYEFGPYFRLDAVVSTLGLALWPERETTIALIGRNLLNAAGPDPGFGGVDYPLVPLSILLELRQRF